MEPAAQMPAAAERDPAAAEPAAAAEPPAVPPPPAERAESATGGAPTGDVVRGAPAESPKRDRAAKGSAVDQARASGVLGPTDRAVFDVRGKVTLEATMKAADEALRPKLDAVQACYEKVLAFEENLAGKLTLQISAGKLTVVRRTLKHADLEKCVLDALATATLPNLGKATITLAFARE